MRGQRVRARGIALVGVGCGSLANGTLLMVQALRDQSATGSLWFGIVALQLLCPLAFWLRRAGEEARVDALLAYLLLLCTYFEVFRGITVSTGLGHVTLLMLCSLFYGGSGLRAGSWATLVALAVAGSLLALRVVPPWPAALWDPHEPLVWLRYSVVLACYGGGTAAAFALLIDSLERAARGVGDTLQRERWERVQREATQRSLEATKRLEVSAQAAAAMAQEFGHGLAAIATSANVLRDRPHTDAEVMALADDILVHTQRGMELTERARSLAISGPGAAAPARLDGILMRSLPALREALSGGVQLQFEAAAQPVVAIDGAQLQAALLELALNARDTMPDGGTWSVEITEQKLSTVPVGWSAQPGSFAVVTCTDTGAGMSVEAQDHLFEPFFTTKPAGSGLGLASVRKLISDARGFIEVSARPGVGTTFRLFLPTQTDELLSSPPPAAADAEVESAKTPLA